MGACPGKLIKRESGTGILCLEKSLLLYILLLVLLMLDAVVLTSVRAPGRLQSLRTDEQRGADHAVSPSSKNCVRPYARCVQRADAYLASCVQRNRAKTRKLRPKLLDAKWLEFFRILHMGGVPLTYFLICAGARA